MIAPCVDLRVRLDDHLSLLAVAEDANDGDLMMEIEMEMPELVVLLDVVERQAMFRGPDDTRNAVITIQAGAGGTDAMDWAEQLERMYLRYFDREGLEAEITDRLQGGNAGIHYSEIEVRGPYAYGKLKSERGVHRIQHVSAFDANGKKQTSFASVDVMAIHPEVMVSILEKDLEIDTFCSGGPGGQNVNKVASAVRVRHLPTGVTVKCQSQRSQLQNKVIALEILGSKLRQKEEDKKEKRPKLEACFGHQTRSYVIEPYQLVKDHITGYETSATHKVLDGDLGPLVDAYLSKNWKEMTMLK